MELTKKVQNKQKEYIGNYSYLVYRIQYDKQEAQEVITIRQPIGGETSEIAGHYLSVEIVEPAKLLERIFKEQSGEQDSKEESTKKEPKVEKSPVESSSQESTTEENTKGDKK